MRRHTSIRWVQGIAVVALVAGTLVPTSQGQGLQWRPFEAALAAADSTDRFVMVAVYAPWCGWCRKMKREVYPSEAVRSCLAGRFVSTRLNRDDTETTYRYRGRRLTARRLASALHAEAVPTTVLLSPRGEYLVHLPGYVEPGPLRSLLAYVSTRAYRDGSYQEFRTGSVTCGGDGPAD
jgi:thioredoxin-related protein